jgi:hypothetical protein
MEGVCLEALDGGPTFPVYLSRFDLHIDYTGAKLGEHVNSSIDRLSEFWRGWEVACEEVPDYAYGHAVERQVRDGAVRLCPPRGSHCSCASENAIDEGAVGDCSCDRADMVQRGCERKYACPADLAVGGLEADYPAECCGAAD